MVPYAGNPASCETTCSILSGSDPPSSTIFNTTSEGILDKAAGLAVRAPRVGEEWRNALPVLGLGSASAPQMFHPGYDASQGTFLQPYSATIVGMFSGFVQWTLGADDASPGAGTLPPSWANVGGSGAIAQDTVGIIDMASCGDPATGGVVWAAALLSNSAELIVSDATYTGSSWSNKYTLSTAGSAPRYVEIAGIGTHVVVAIGLASGGMDCVYSGTSSGGFAAIGGSLAGPSISGWSLCSNGSVLIACPTLTRATTPTLWTTPDGVTFTAQNISSIVPVGAFVVGVTWAPLQALFYMAVQVTSSSVAIYSSPTGVTWTQTSSGSGPDVLLADFAACQIGLVATTIDDSIANPFPLTHQSQIAYSADWGLTWRASPAQLPTNLATSAPGYSRARLAAGVQQLYVSNSQYLRFSRLYGLPSSTL